jgi:hypothetical protein
VEQESGLIGNDSALFAGGSSVARIENHKYTIEQAFREGFYIVPDYQREYVWTDKEIQQLLDDINDEIDAGSSHEYFIGTVLVSPTDEKSRHEVIDSQQRLTTLPLAYLTNSRGASTDLNPRKERLAALKGALIGQ